MSRYTRPFTRILRKYTRPLRDPFRRRVSAPFIQRQARLLPEDRDKKRRRWHVLVDLVHEHCPPTGVVMAEIGVRTGDASRHVLRYCPQLEILYGVDLVEPDPSVWPYAEEPRFHFIQGWSHEVAQSFEDESLDIVFIDAEHTEEAVRQDAASWLPKVKTGGVVSGHDYGSKNHPGVAVAVDDIFKTHRHPVRLDANKVWWTIK